VPFVCGGVRWRAVGSAAGFQSKCYSYNFGADSWTPTGSMPYAAAYMGFDYSPSWGLGIVFTLNIVVSAKQFTHRTFIESIFPLHGYTKKHKKQGFLGVYLYPKNRLMINYCP
jgi:hypothetical protein